MVNNYPAKSRGVSRLMLSQRGGFGKSGNIPQARGLVSKETVVLRRWGRETQNFGFIN